ncbi:hypothetical protein PR048_006582 [Dryococelus australis]|uniref:Uncharacterized protein n=1 Tax=Dryococelus australis TaxID=614101 RepID=A0ABQ9IBF2_9NEOP|nr:hypothetical protein PR048_006582 [Dryococelus australis]
MTRVFVETNIPLEKLDNPKLWKWMTKYIKGSGDLPTASRLREGHVPEIIRGEEAKLKAVVKDQRDSILCDETTGRKGRTVCLRRTLSLLLVSARYTGKCISAVRILLLDELGHTQCWAHKLNLVGNVWAVKLTDLNNCVVQTKHLFLNTRKRKHEYNQFLTEKYNDETKKPKVIPIPAVTRWNSWFKCVEYLCEYLYELNLRKVLMMRKTSAELSQLSKQGQVQLTSMFKSVGERSLETLHHLINSDAGKDISSLGQLFDPRNVVQSDLGHNDDCKSISKLPLLRELPSSQVVEPYSAFRDGICSICKEGKYIDAIVVLFSVKSMFSCFVNATVKSLWIPVNNVDCEKTFSIYSCVMSDKSTNLAPDNMEIMLSMVVSD